MEENYEVTETTTEEACEIPSDEGISGYLLLGAGALIGGLAVAGSKKLFGFGKKLWNECKEKKAKKKVEKGETVTTEDGTEVVGSDDEE